MIAAASLAAGAADPPSPAGRAPATGRAANRPPVGNLADYLSSDDYPSESLRRNEQGVVRFVVTVTPNGRVDQCVILQSSGYSHLDEGTCHFARLRLRFRPGHTEGVPVTAVSREFRIRWSIQGE